VAYDVQVKELPAQLALTFHTRSSMATIGEALGEAFSAIMASAEATRAQFAGPPFALYPAEVTAEFDVVVCMPVAPGASATADVGLEDVPGGTCVSTLHRGSYERLGDAYGALQAWIVANGKKPSGPCREVYLNEVGLVPEGDLLTEIDWPFV
jgi:effector-binding domain-containing protein